MKKNIFQKRKKPCCRESFVGSPLGARSLISTPARLARDLQRFLPCGMPGAAWIWMDSSVSVSSQDHAARSPCSCSSHRPMIHPKFPASELAAIDRSKVGCNNLAGSPQKRRGRRHPQATVASTSLPLPKSSSGAARHRPACDACRERRPGL